MGEDQKMTDTALSRQEWIDERAAILEFDAGFERAFAEIIAEELGRKRARRAQDAIPDNAS